MKKLFTLVLLSSIVYAATAQTSKKSTQFGLKAGLNAANFTIKSGGYTISPSALTRFTGGGFAIIPVSQKFAIQPEVLYSGMGFKVDVNKLKLGYIAIPVLAKYKLAPGLSAYVGPQLDFLLSAKANGEDVKSDLKSTNVSATFGADYTLKNGINFSARYLTGLTNISKDPDNTGTYKTNAFSITVGYIFGSK